MTATPRPAEGPAVFVAHGASPVLDAVQTASTQVHAVTRSSHHAEGAVASYPDAC